MDEAPGSSKQVSRRHLPLVLEVLCVNLELSKIALEGNPFLVKLPGEMW